MRIPGRRVAPVAAIAVLALAGCAGGSVTAGPAASAAVDAPAFVSTDEAHAVAGCLRPGDTALVLDAPGVPTEALTFGAGDRAVILAHQAEQGPCAWDAYGRTIAEQGWRVFIPSMTAEPAALMEAAVAWLTSQGVTGYAMVGASMGAAASLVAASAIDPAPALVVAISSPDVVGDIDAVGSIADVAAPILLIAATGDDDFAAQAERLQSAQPAARLLVVAGPAHGTALLASDPSVRSAVDEALRWALG